MTKFLNISTDTTLGGNAPSDELAVSQKAIKTYVDNHSGGGSVAIDNSTITKNVSDEIQAVATVNANTAAGATNPIYDWVGTLAEYTAQDIQNQHPDWLCFITDDFTAQAYDAYSKTQSDTLLAAKVNTGHEVIEFQSPTAGNGYTWYRKYADGWVEQGGVLSGASISVSTGGTTLVGSVVFPVEILNVIQMSLGNVELDYFTVYARNVAGTGMDIRVGNPLNATRSESNYSVMWEVKGMVA